MFSPENIIYFASWSFENMKLMDHALQYTLLARKPLTWSTVKHWGPQRHCWELTSPVLGITGKGRFLGRILAVHLGSFCFVAQCVHPHTPTSQSQLTMLPMAEKGGGGKLPPLTFSWQSSFRPPLQLAFKVFLIPSKTWEVYKEDYVPNSLETKLNKINFLYILFQFKKKT